MIDPGFEILRLCVRLDDNDRHVSEARTLISNSQADWDDIFERAAMHSVRPQLAMLAGKLEADLIPAVFREKISKAYQENQLRQLRNTGEFFRIRQILVENKIRVIPFKGFWIAHEMYGNLADREAVDVDLFIDLGDLDRVIILMKQNGYLPEVSDDPGYVSKIKKESAEYNFDMFEGNERLFHFEFHWKIGSSLHDMEIGIGDLASRIKSASLQNHDLEVFSPSALLLLSVMHHGGKDTLIQLKQVLDIGYIIKNSNDIDWNWVTFMSGKYHIEKVLYLSISLAAELTGVEVPQQLRSKVETYSIKRLTRNRLKAMSFPPDKWYRNMSDFKELVYHIRTRTGTIFRIRMLFRYIKSLFVQLLFPGNLVRLYMRKRYRIQA